MTPRLSYHPLAEIELVEAALYYGREGRGLGGKCLDAVEKCTEAVASNPEAGTLLNDVVRRRLVTGFPYGVGVLYRVTPDRIRVLAIMNLKRRPNYWTGRT